MKSSGDKNFHADVLTVVRKIPHGKVLTYQEVARRAGSPRAFRAVGNILNKNRDLKIPCHRVIRSDGGIGGYNRGAKNKIRILKQEGVAITTCEFREEYACYKNTCCERGVRLDGDSKARKLSSKTAVEVAVGCDAQVQIHMRLFGDPKSHANI